MWKYLKKYWVYGLLAPLFMVGEVAMDLFQPKLMSIIIDDGVLGLNQNHVGNMEIVIKMGLLMIGLVIIGGIAGILSGVFANLCSQNFSNDVRKACFEKMMSFSFQETDRFTTGSLVTRVTNDVNQVQVLVAQCIRGFVRTFFLFAGGIFCMLSLNLSFATVLLCTLPVVAVLIIVLIIKVNPIFRILQTKLDRVNSVMQENVAGTRVVKAYVKEEYEKKRFGRANTELADTQIRVLRMISYLTPLMNVALNLAVVAVIYVGSVEVQAGAITPGKIMAAITYLTQILNAIMMLAMIFQSVSRGTASASRLQEILSCESTIKDGNGADHTSQTGTIEFQNVSFSYPGSGSEKVLDGISFRVDKGETVALLGATGSGKTSLVQLIPRFYDATEGTILINGQDVKDYRLNDLRERIAYVLQKSELFSRTIAENISFGRKESSFDDIKKAADISQANEFIQEKEEGYETLVAEKGMSLSGGQKQRIAISRAVLKEAEIMIFDDATSALDLHTEASFYEALNREYQDSTKLIIAQRIASVMNADRIMVLHNGEIVASDTHEKLLKTCEIYQDIYQSQRKGQVNENGR